MTAKPLPQYPKYYILSALLLLVLCFVPATVWGQEIAAAHYQAGIKQSQQKNWKEAAAEFTRAVTLNPKHDLAHANLGVALSRLGHHKEALLQFEQALRLGYDHAFLRYNRGLSFVKLNLIEEATQEMEKALAMDSRMVKADYELGILYLRRQRIEDARNQVDKLYRRNYKLAKKLYDQVPPDYTIVSVDNGGSATGRVRLTGPVPKPRSFHLIHAPNIQFCSRISDGKGHRLLFDFTVSDKGGLKDTVIALLRVRKGKPFSSEMLKFNISRCHSDKYVIGIKNSEDFLIQNTDPIRHEIATYELKGSYVRQISNRPVDKKTSQVRNAFVRKDVDRFLIKCNLHPFLQTRAFMVSNPYYAISDAEGRFVIKDILPGTYDVIAWHPFIPTQTGTVTIEPGGESQINFAFNGADARRKLYHDDMEGYRFQPWYDSFEKFYGGPRVDDPVEILQKF